MNKTTILSVLAGGALILGVVFIIFAFIYANKPADIAVVEEPQEITFAGRVVAVDLEGMMVDGPAKITVEGATKEVRDIAIASMGRSLCVAKDTIASPHNVSVGDYVVATGELLNTGTIVPCLKPTHAFTVSGTVSDAATELSFSYPKGPRGYVLNQSQVLMSVDPSFLSGYILTLESDVASEASSAEAREGSPTIQVRVYSNTSSSSARTWSEAHPLETNIELALSDPIPTEVAGVTGVSYTADGLYASKVVVVTNNEFVYVFTVAYLDESSPAVAAFEALLSSVEIGDVAVAGEVVEQETKPNTFSGILEEVNVGCFVDGECYVVVAGKHVTVLRGWSSDTVGKVLTVPSFGDLENFIGEVVEVRAKSLSDGTYTLYGSEDYYIQIKNGGAVTVSLGEVGVVGDIKITPKQVLEDSRCPLDVQCIQAGTVRVVAILQSALGTSEQIFELGESVTTEAQEITLKQVEPTPHSETTIGGGEYTFTFKVIGR